MSSGRAFLKCTGTAAMAVLFLAAAASADVIVVNDQTQTAIQTALNHVHPPGTVIIPAGRYRLDQRDALGRLVPLRIRSSDITVQGDGSDQTVLYRDPADDDPSVTYMLRSIGNARVRITGIRFEGVSFPDPSGQEGSIGHEIGVDLQDSEDFRVDHCYFTHTGFGGVRTYGLSSGVVDHSTFVDNFKIQNRNANPDGYGVAVYGVDSGLPANHQPFGSPLATFIEDSSFQGCRHAATANKTGRYVFRFNYVSQNVIAHAVDAHGVEYNSQDGTDWIDVHDNLIEDPNGPCNPPGNSASCYAVNIRGGKGLIWNNQFLHYNQGIELRQDTAAVTGPVYIYNDTLLVNEGTHSRCPNSETSPMLCVTGTQGTPTYEFDLPPDYVPYQYPHPLVTDGARADSR